MVPLDGGVVPVGAGVASPVGRPGVVPPEDPDGLGVAPPRGVVVVVPHVTNGVGDGKGVKIGLGGDGIGSGATELPGGGQLPNWAERVSTPRRITKSEPTTTERFMDD